MTQKIKLEDSWSGTHISSVAQSAVEKLATYGDQDVEVWEKLANAE